MFLKKLYFFIILCYNFAEIKEESGNETNDG